MPRKGNNPIKAANQQRLRTSSNKEPTGRNSSLPKKQFGERSSIDAREQAILDVFSKTFSELFDENLKSRIQTVKTHLYNRDFEKAFGPKDFLEAYTIRWSPSRALAYYNLLGLPHSRLLDDILVESRNFEDTPQNHPNTQVDGEGRVDRKSSPCYERRPRRLRVLSIGGGAGAEIVAFAAMTGTLSSTKTCDDQNVAGEEGQAISLSLHIVDIADWASVTKKLLDGIISMSAKQTEKCASANEKKTPVRPSDQIEIAFEQQDILEASIDGLKDMVQDCSLITILFTLNELYSTSLNKTTKFLVTLTEVVAPMTLLLVVDSPGTYSTINMRKDGKYVEDKKYPMHWMLDHTLVGRDGTTKDKTGWEKLQEDESRWFRLRQGLIYPIDLEDMRYQLHLYRKK